MPDHKPWPFRVAILAAAQRGAALASGAGQCLRLSDLLQQGDASRADPKSSHGNSAAHSAPVFHT